MLLVFLYLIAANNNVLVLYACAHKISLTYLFPEKIVIEICCQKCKECNTFCVTTCFFLWISRVCQIKNIKYIHQNLRYYETIVQLLYLSGNHLPLLMIYKNKMVTPKNLILQYIGMTNINTLKRNCHVGINVVFLEVILKMYDVCFMKNIFIASWTCLHRFDRHISIRWLENVKVNNILFTLC